MKKQKLFSQNSAFRTLFSRKFWLISLPLIIPITLQNLLTSSFSIVDTLMVGQLGDTAIAAVGAAAQISNFSNILFFGIAGGGIVFISQYWGAQNIRGIRRVYGLVMLITLPLAFLFVLAGSLIPTQLVSVFTDDPDLIREGAKYLKIACWSYIGVSMNQIFCFILRATEEVRLPLITNIFSVCLNAATNYILIFGKLGFPAMGVQGAAIATCISANAGAILLFILAFLQHQQIRAPIKQMLDIDRDFIKVYIRRSLPVLLNEGLWSLGVMGYNMVFGRLGAGNYAALTIYRTIENLGYVFFIGMCNASAVLVGKAVGEEDFDGAKRLSGCFMLLIPIGSIVIGSILFAFSKPILSLFSVSSEVYNTAHRLLILYSIDMAILNIPYVSICGVFRPGGDTKNGLKYDIMTLYLLGLPSVIISAFLLKLPFFAVYIVMVVMETIPKDILCVKHYLSYKWIMPVKE